MVVKQRINDIHVHLGKSSIINQHLKLEDLLKFRKKSNIENFALISLDCEISKNNRSIIRLSKKHKFIHGLYWIRKERIPNDIDILKKTLGDGIIGVKFHGVFENKKVTSKIYDPIMKLLQEKKAVLLIHCGRFKDGSPSSNSSFVHALKIAKKYPKIKVILAHMGGNDTSIVKKAINAARNIPNTFFDTSGISTPYRIEYGVQVIGAKRILFGSDFPWCSHRGMYFGVEDALISKKDKELILNKNFLNLIS